MRLLRGASRAGYLAAAASLFLLPGILSAQLPEPARTAVDATANAAQNAVDGATRAAQSAVAAATKLPTKIGDTMSAKPFTLADKFDYRIVQSFGARAFVGAA